jgi:hypothetical protein
MEQGGLTRFSQQIHAIVAGHRVGAPVAADHS